jgi:hypothetical protein
MNLNMKPIHAASMHFEFQNEMNEFDGSPTYLIVERKRNNIRYKIRIEPIHLDRTRMTCHVGEYNDLNEIAACS